MIPWQEIFSKTPVFQSQPDEGALAIGDLAGLKNFLDAIHIRHCLVKPYQQLKSYPLVESRELLPSFENGMLEYKNLPGFAMVAFGRQLDYFSEVFQFDKLHSVHVNSEAACCPLENQVITQNMHTLASRLPKTIQEKLRQTCGQQDVTLLDNYGSLLPFLLEMDRAQVFALDEDKLFHLAGIFASFPSDIDSELKRFGIKIGKFVYGDSEKYERNRMFVYQYLMELYGFPIVSERRTSSALFARKLHRMGENFILRVLGQTDRTLTTYSSGENRRYPRVEKIALIAVDEDQTNAIELITRKGFFLDERKRVVIMRVTYRQHRYNSDNLRQDRALSVASQEILHPLTGEALSGLNIIKDTSNMFLRLNDIVRGEYTGRIVYKRTEIVENTDTDEKRLKFIYSWLTKHHRRMITYGDEFYNSVIKVLKGYLHSPKKAETFERLRELYQEVVSKLSYIQQARRVRLLQDIARRSYMGKRITYREMFIHAIRLLTDLQYELGHFFPNLVDMTIKSVEAILHDKYLEKHYIIPPEGALTSAGQEIRKNYGRMVSILDSIKSVKKARTCKESHRTAEAALA